MQNCQTANLKSSLLDTAEKLFLQFGVRSVSIDDICGDLHISKKTFYAIFPQKEELLRELLQRQLSQKVQVLWSRLQNRKITVMEGQEPNVIDRLFNLNKFITLSEVHFLNSDKKLSNFEYDLRKYYPDIHEQHLDRIHAELSRHIFKGIQSGVQEGLFREEYCSQVMAGLLACQWMHSIRYILENCQRTADKQTAFFLLIDSQIMTLCSEDGLKYYFRRKTASKDHS